jgi:hypothetical protein
MYCGNKVIKPETKLKYATFYQTGLRIKENADAAIIAIQPTKKSKPYVIGWR